jgi:hypothetical protein
MQKQCLCCSALSKVPGTPDDELISHGICRLERCRTLYDAWTDDPDEGRSLGRFIREYENAGTTQGETTEKKEK